jgi:hypothetical protein
MAVSRQGLRRASVPAPRWPPRSSLGRRESSPSRCEPGGSRVEGEGEGLRHQFVGPPDVGLRVGARTHIDRRAELDAHPLPVPLRRDPNGPAREGRQIADQGRVGTALNASDPKILPVIYAAKAWPGDRDVPLMLQSAVESARLADSTAAPRWRRSPPPGFVHPCEPALLTARPPDPASCTKSSMTISGFLPASRASARRSEAAAARASAIGSRPPLTLRGKPAPNRSETPTL